MLIDRRGSHTHTTKIHITVNLDHVSAASDSNIDNCGETKPAENNQIICTE